MHCRSVVVAQELWHLLVAWISIATLYQKDCLFSLSVFPLNSQPLLF